MQSTLRWCKGEYSVLRSVLRLRFPRRLLDTAQEVPVPAPVAVAVEEVPVPLAVEEEEQGDSRCIHG